MKPIRSRRRTFLRGLGGVLVGLPFLEALELRGVRAQAAPTVSPIRRFVAFHECNGVEMARFWPNVAYGALTPASFDAGCALFPVAKYAGKMLIPRGIHMVPKGFGFDDVPGCDHQKGMGHKLTAAPLDGTGDNYASGISVDQEMAKSINPMARPSLTLLVGEQRTGVLGHISYRGPSQPVTGENNPWLAYQDFMGLTTADPGVAQRMLTRRQSVLDLVKGEMDDLKKAGLSAADKAKLDMHYTSIRELEQGMSGAGLSCSLDDARAQEIQAIDPNTIQYDSEFKKIGQMQMDILALALACDYTRVATLQWGGGSGGPVFRWDGMNHDYNHHKLSHGNTKDDNSGSDVAGYLDMLYDIDRWFATQYLYLLDKLDAYDEGGMSLLDNSAVMYQNELSHGKDHDFRDLPYVITGSCGGYFKQAQYIKVTAQTDTRQDQDAPHNKLLTTLLNAVGAKKTGGAPYDTFGTYGEAGELTELKA